MREAPKLGKRILGGVAAIGLAVGINLAGVVLTLPFGAVGSLLRFAVDIFTLIVAIRYVYKWAVKGEPIGKW